MWGGRPAVSVQQGSSGAGQAAPDPGLIPSQGAPPSSDITLPPLTAPPPLTEPPVQRAADAAGPLRAHASPSWQRSLVRSIVLVDLCGAFAAALVALAVRFPVPPVPYVVATFAFPVLWVVANALTRSYEPRFLGTGSEEYRRVFDAGVRLLAVTALVSVAVRAEPARRYVLIIFPLAVACGLLGRYLLRQRLHRRRAKGAYLHHVVVVGRERSASELIRQLRREIHASFSVVGVCVDRTQSSTIEGVPVVGTSTTIVEALRRTGADTVAVGAWSDLTQADLRRLSWELEGSGVSLVVAPSLTDIAGPRIHIRPVSGLPLLHIEEPELTGGRRVLKSVVDRSVALVSLLLLGPLLLAVAVMVRLDSAGPAFFRQVRVGMDGSVFTIYKLRSMHADAEQRLAQLAGSNDYGDGPLFKIADDPRVTRIGRWLRRYSIDELPQLLNVLKGDMSLVGPRPPLPNEVSQYATDVRRRLLVKPGVTGLWQISGRSGLSWDESVRLDLHYVESWSLALDAMILWKTVFAVLKRDGAY